MPNGVAGGMMQAGGVPNQRPQMGQPGNPNINLVTALTQPPGPNKGWRGIQITHLTSSTCSPS